MKPINPKGAVEDGFTVLVFVCVCVALSAVNISIFLKALGI